MNNELSKNLKCLLMRSGVQVWLEDEYMIDLKKTLLHSKESKFMEIGDEIVNTADLSGVFTPETMADYVKRKNGEWQDENGEWHRKRERVCCKGNIVSFGMKCGYCAI